MNELTPRKVFMVRSASGLVITKHLPVIFSGKFSYFKLVSTPLRFKSSSVRNLTVELAARMAEKLVRRAMQDNEEVLRVWLEEAIIAMRDARELRILVNPGDFSVAGRFLQNLTKMIPQAALIEVIPDPEISLGGCIVRSMHGFIDQQLETQLQRLVEQLQ